MRTTISIDDGLLAEVRRRAAELGQTVSQVIEDGVRDSLFRARGTDRATFRVQPFSGGDQRPGVDLDDNAAMAELMDGRRSPRAEPALAR